LVDEERASAEERWLKGSETWVQFEKMLCVAGPQMEGNGNADNEQEGNQPSYLVIGCWVEGSSVANTQRESVLGPLQPPLLFTLRRVKLEVTGLEGAYGALNRFEHPSLGTLLPTAKGEVDDSHNHHLTSILPSSPSHSPSCFVPNHCEKRTTSSIRDHGHVSLYHSICILTVTKQGKDHGKKLSELTERVHLVIRTTTATTETCATWPSLGRLSSFETTWTSDMSWPATIVQRHPSTSTSGA
jgi:hypothetical protein